MSEFLCAIKYLTLFSNKKQNFKVSNQQLEKNLSIET